MLLSKIYLGSCFSTDGMCFLRVAGGRPGRCWLAGWLSGRTDDLRWQRRVNGEQGGGGMRRGAEVEAGLRAPSSSDRIVIAPCHRLRRCRRRQRRNSVQVVHRPIGPSLPTTAQRRQKARVRSSQTHQSLFTFARHDALLPYLTLLIVVGCYKGKGDHDESVDDASTATTITTTTTNVLDRCARAGFLT